MADLRLAADRAPDLLGGAHATADLEAESGSPEERDARLRSAALQRRAETMCRWWMATRRRATPLSVRRAAPVPPRLRIEAPVREEPALDFPEVTAAAQPARHRRCAACHRRGGHGRRRPRRSGGSPARRSTRSSSARIDAGVLYFTLWMLRLAIRRRAGPAAVPMPAFLLHPERRLPHDVHGGRRADDRQDGRAHPRRAGRAGGPAAAACRSAPPLVRAAACFVSVLPAGAGFFMALFRADGRALHDAVADTRVIKA